MSAGLNIVVCIKQVPETTEVNFDEETGRLIREGVAAVINPFDEIAIEEGLRIKEEHGGVVKVLTMGPPWAANALRDAIAMGADEGYLATDRAFAGADTWATSLTLAKAIDHMGGYDIIICGLKTTDGDTGQTGPEMAEHMGIPHVCYVNEIVKKILPKDEDKLGNAPLGKTFEECYDLETLEPSKEYQEIYGKVKAEFKDHGIDYIY